jgi:hypothetical protein
MADLFLNMTLNTQDVAKASYRSRIAYQGNSRKYKEIFFHIFVNEDTGKFTTKVGVEWKLPSLEGGRRFFNTVPQAMKFFNNIFA